MVSRPVVNVHTTPKTITEEFEFTATSVDQNIAMLFEERFFQGGTLEIYTGPGQTGVMLQPITDYALNFENVVLSEEVGVPIYGELKIVNATYLNVPLYIPANDLLLHGDFVDQTDVNNLITAVGQILTGTADYVISQSIYLPVYTDLSSYGFLPFGFDNAVRKVDYPELYNTIGDLWEEMHTASGDPVSGSDYFYPTPIPGYYEKSALPNIDFDNTNVDFTNNLIITLPSWVNPTNRRNGSVFNLKLVSGTLPTGLSEQTYYVRFTAAESISLHPTEQDAIDNANIVTFTDAGSGEFRLTQAGLSLENALQKFDRYNGVGGDVPSIWPYGAITNGVPGAATSRLDSKTGLGPTHQGLCSDPIDDGVNGVPRTSNQTRGDEVYMYGYVKAERISYTGDPISTLKQEISLTVPADGSTNVITHNLNAKLEELIIEIKYKDVSGNLYDVYKDAVVGAGVMIGYGFNNNGLIGSTTQFNLQIGESGQRYAGPTGNVATITPGTGTYEITLYKPNILANYFSVDQNQVFEITDSVDRTWKLPDATITLGDYTVVRRGAGSGKVTPVTVGGQLIGGLAGTEWELFAEGRLVLFSYNGNWEVKEYYDSDKTFHIQDQKTTGSSGGTFTAGAWQTRDLNTILSNTIPGASLSSNQIILPAGTYEIECSCPSYIVDANAARLQNITDAITLLHGTSEVNLSSNQSRSFVLGVFTIATTKTLEVQHRCTTTKSTNGFGFPTNFSAHETYTDIMIKKIR